MASRRECGGWRPAPALLRLDDSGNVCVIARLGLRARDGLRPRVSIGGVAGKKWGDRIEAIRVVGGEFSDPGESADVDWDPRRRIAGVTRIQLLGGHETLLYHQGVTD